MVKVIVSNESRDWNQIDQHWLCQQINGRRGDGLPVCVQVHVEEDGLNLMLSTPGYGGGGGRPPTAREAEILALWSKLHLNQPDFSCGNVHAFLTQLRKMVG